MSHNLYYFHSAWIPDSDESLQADICVYGGTAAGVSAAVTGSRRGHRVVLLQPGLHIGGMTSGGLTNTDIGRKGAIGGFARRFYQLVGRHYGQQIAWRFEAKVAEKLLNDLLAEANVTVRFGAYLDEVELAGDRIRQITLLGGLRVQARSFIDCTYEGDLMAKAGVDFTVGREGNAAYGESLNGVQVHTSHQFDNPVDPYIIAGDPESGLLPWVNAHDAAPTGTGDGRVQAYNFRVCMTRSPDLRVPFPMPPGYDPADYELCARWLAGTEDNIFRKFDMVTTVKTDTNNHGAVSTDYIGANHQWPNADYETREQIFQDHVRYQQGLHWFMANDPRVPVDIRSRYAEWGLANDEFTDTGHWPHQLYVREGRRMVSDHIVTEQVCFSHDLCDDPVGMGSYQMDSHNCQRVVRDGRVLNEGDVQVVPDGPYPISLRAILPKQGQCSNLTVPVAVSASHIAFGSIRMEPVFMILAESAALATHLAIEADSDLHDVPYADLRPLLDEVDQILEYDPDQEEGRHGNASSPVTVP